MAYLIAIAISFLLLGGFLALTRFETGRGVRFFGSIRTRFDTGVERTSFIIRHVDWSAVLATLVRTAAARIVHDIAHASLIAVRIIERLLTRVVKYLRSSRQQAAATSDRKKFDLRASLAQLRQTLKKAKEEAEV
ncbi:MAG TPA: hypothetical protein VEA92_00965 [Candidatus Paceibacterota bacterium]|nr:hypothetical protein [Candidatus Paceibacterota bacterium]